MDCSSTCTWRPSTGYCSPASASIESVLLSNGFRLSSSCGYQSIGFGGQSRGLHPVESRSNELTSMNELSRRILAKTRTVSRTPAARQTIPREWPALARGDAYFVPQDLALPPRGSASTFRQLGTSCPVCRSFVKSTGAYITSGCAFPGLPLYGPRSGPRGDRQLQPNRQRRLRPVNQRIDGDAAAAGLPPPSVTSQASIEIHLGCAAAHPPLGAKVT